VRKVALSPSVVELLGIHTCETDFLASHRQRLDEKGQNQKHGIADFEALKAFFVSFT
jgi:hypothetical protein